MEVEEEEGYVELQGSQIGTASNVGGRRTSRHCCLNSYVVSYKAAQG